MARPSPASTLPGDLLRQVFEAKAVVETRCWVDDIDGSVSREHVWGPVLDLRQQVAAEVSTPGPAGL